MGTRDADTPEQVLETVMSPYVNSDVLPRRVYRDLTKRRYRNLLSSCLTSHFQLAKMSSSNDVASSIVHPEAAAASKKVNAVSTSLDETQIALSQSLNHAPKDSDEYQKMISGMLHVFPPDNSRSQC